MVGQGSVHCRPLFAMLQTYFCCSKIPNKTVCSHSWLKILLFSKIFDHVNFSFHLILVKIGLIFIFYFYSQNEPTCSQNLFYDVLNKPINLSTVPPKKTPYAGQRLKGVWLAMTAVKDSMAFLRPFEKIALISFFGFYLGT